ncbi:MAG: hypothetical protein Q8K60_08580 [Parachlamydiaceae bacterium]|nr:hypothetical protein [Parachlamydiaceae bacterium]
MNTDFTIDSPRNFQENTQSRINGKTKSRTRKHSSSKYQKINLDNGNTINNYIKQITQIHFKITVKRKGPYDFKHSVYKPLKSDTYLNQQEQSNKQESQKQNNAQDEIIFIGEINIGDCIILEDSPYKLPPIKLQSNQEKILLPSINQIFPSFKK